MGTQRYCTAHHVLVPLLALLPTCGGRGLLVARTLVSCAVDEPSTGRWPDGHFRHCVTLSYDYRGEWSLPPHSPPPDAA